MVHMMRYVHAVVLLVPSVDVPASKLWATKVILKLKPLLHRDKYTAVSGEDVCVCGFQAAAEFDSRKVAGRRLSLKSIVTDQSSPTDTVLSSARVVAIAERRS
ncbi:hypothetical protein R1flu_017555 [Riccia fluitans]|uniref:Secreted protein n=1 Tax=Riccia fluitans TaxID=41844 RepID=A0ABD1ZDA3_9MARC